MRQRMLDGHKNPTELFDIKHDRGGMVDIEFVVQYLALAYSKDFPELVGNLGNIHLLAIAADSGLISMDLARDCSEAYRKYRAIQREVRLAQGDGPVRVDPARVEGEIASVSQLWNDVIGAAAQTGEEAHHAAS